MEEIVINRGKRKQYIFSEERILVKKRDKIKYDISAKDIRIIYYCPKVLVGSWLIAILFHSPEFFPAPPIHEIFFIHIRGKKKIIRLKIKRDEFEKIYAAFKLPIQIINEWITLGV